MKSIPGLNDYFRELSAQVLLENLDDGQLLERFLHRRDEVAFALLVSRHGPMVLGVCRRILCDPHDADDAFQATFLVLAKKANSVRPRDRVGAWLHGVARRSALKLRSARSRQSAGQYRVPIETASSNEVGIEILDEELGRLPAIYRSALVLCELEGRTLKEASVQLNLPPGTLASRVSRGRELLARRVRARGLFTVTGAGLVAVPSAELLAATAQSLILPSANLAAFTIAQGVTTAMLTAKVQSVFVVAFGVAATVGIAAGVGFGQGAKSEKVDNPPIVKAAEAKVTPKSAIDDEELKKTPFDAKAFFHSDDNGWIVGDSFLTSLPEADAAPDDEMRSYSRNCVRACGSNLSLLFGRFDLGKDPLLNILGGISNLTKSRLELCVNNAQRLAVLKDQYRLYFAVMSFTKVRVDSGTRPQQELDQVEFYRWDAKLQFRKLELAMAK